MSLAVRCSEIDIVVFSLNGCGACVRLKQMIASILANSSDPKRTISFREEFRALLGVRKYPKNESLVLWAVAMGISAEGLDWWGLLKP
ncbi:hypothetical protein, partial [Aquidulcibacter sp.]|uniref:hypothetical protein n=1 Tax=Aquidulcibacter sp. TaxID=2052990 RepID=UPI0028AE02F4